MSALTIAPLPKVGRPQTVKSRPAGRRGHLYVVPDLTEQSPLQLDRPLVSASPKRSPKVARGAETTNQEATFADLDQVTVAPLNLNFILGLLFVVAAATLMILGWTADVAPQQLFSTQVMAGDSLFSIAQRISPANTDLATVVEEIKNLNGLTGNGVEVGQTLLIPAK